MYPYKIRDYRECKFLRRVTFTRTEINCQIIKKILINDNKKYFYIVLIAKVLKALPSKDSQLFYGVME